MGRITRNYMLPIGTALFVVGLVITALAWTVAYSRTDLVDFWRAFIDVIPGQSRDQDWNILFMILGPVLLITGAFYAGEQLLLRRRFERMIATTKKSEFVRDRKELEDLAKRLPTGSRHRVLETEESFRSMR